MVNATKQTQLDIVYNGPAVADGSMNVKDLAPAMLSIGTLFEAANSVSNGQLATVNIRVRATSTGSFHILYEVLQTSQTIDPNLVATAEQIRDWLVGGIAIGASVFGVIKWVRGQKPKLTKVNEELYELTINNETYQVPTALLHLYQNVAVRQSIADMVRPIKTPGIDYLQIKEGQQVIQEVNKNDIEYFDMPVTQDLLLDEVRRQNFTITSLSFKEANKWRLTDGQDVFPVSMKDADFQYRVDNNLISFAKGDILLCDLRIVQWQVQSGIKTDYEVIKVVKHIPARQLPLFQEDNTEIS